MILKKILGWTILPLALVACNPDITGEGGSKEGYVRFTIENDADVNVVSKSTVSDYTKLPSSSDFVISVKSSDGLSVYDGPVSLWDSEKKLKVGNYSVTAVCGEEGAEGFDKPYFKGTADFAIEGGKVSAVSVPASLSNSIVKVTCSEKFSNYFTDWNFKLTTGSGVSISFPKGETRAAFIEAYKFTISGSFTSQGGKVKEFSKDYNNLDPATCYTLSFDASNIGGLKVSVSFDNSVGTIDCPDVELND